MNDQSSLNGLKLFLRAYGVISLVLFGGLFVLMLMDAPVLQEGGALRFMRWTPLAKHIELMLEGVYFVWAIFFFAAASDPPGYLSFVNFTVWANAVHGLIMLAQTMVMPEFRYKIFTDAAYCLVLAEACSCCGLAERRSGGPVEGRVPRAVDDAIRPLPSISSTT
jgi:hypothetical protein